MSLKWEALTISERELAWLRQLEEISREIARGAELKPEDLGELVYRIKDHQAQEPPSCLRRVEVENE